MGLCDCMPYIDLRDQQEGLAMLQTVPENYEGYMKRQVEKATLAQEVQAMIGHPTDARFKQLVSKRVLKDCPLTADDVTNAISIFGPDLAGIT